MFRVSGFGFRVSWFRVSGIGFRGFGFLVSCFILGDWGAGAPGVGFRVSSIVWDWYLVFSIQDSGVRGSGSKFWVSGSGFRVSCVGFRVSGVVFEVAGSGLRVSGFRFRGAPLRSYPSPSPQPPPHT